MQEPGDRKDGERDREQAEQSPQERTQHVIGYSDDRELW
jgi:hypothetical protein